MSFFYLLILGQNYKVFDVNTVWEPKKYRPSRRRIMNRSTECKHKPIPDYDHGQYQRIYIELKEEGEFT
jgi:hypothetical protein